MLDPVVYAAFVVILAWLIKLGAAAVGIVLDDAVYNALAGAIVSALLAWLSANLFKAGVRRVMPKLFERGLLKD